MIDRYLILPTSMFHFMISDQLSFRFPMKKISVFSPTRAAMNAITLSSPLPPRVLPPRLAASPFVLCLGARYSRIGGAWASCASARSVNCPGLFPNAVCHQVAGCSLLFLLCVL